MELNQRESEYLVKYLKEVQGTFQANKYTWIDPNNKDYYAIVAEQFDLINSNLVVKYRFEFYKEDWEEHYVVNIPLIDFIIFCSQSKEN